MTDDTYHWEECACGDIINKAEHSSSTWETDWNNHWKVCDTCGVEFAKDVHDIELDNTCSVCGYEQKALSAITIYMVGDSTMCEFSDSIYIPRYGYGTQLANYFTDAVDADGNPLVTVKNLAWSGRSSVTYITNEDSGVWYNQMVNGISEGDYLIIGFGHNDEKSGDTYTDANIAYGTDTDGLADGFQDNLYNNYIKVAEDAGATPILCTPIARYDSQHRYEDSSYVHVYDYGDYPAAIRTLGEKTNTTVIDLTAITAADYIALGDDAQWYHSFGSATATEDETAFLAREIETTSSTETDKKTQLVVPAGRDDTHLNMYGAKMVAYEFAEALSGTNNSLADYLASDIVKPTMETDFTDEVFNADYRYREYTEFNPETDASTKWGTFPDGWYGTGFGVIGKTDNCTVKYENGTYTVGMSGSNGKFASGQDGLAAAFTQIGIEDGFEATAKVTVTENHWATAGDNNTPKSDTQVGFGMMLRDDIYIDTVDSAITSNFVTAGVIGYGDSYANFSRIEGTLNNKKSADKLTNSYEKDSVYELKMVRENQTITCTTTPQDDSAAVTTTQIDVQFYHIDENYVYLCLFASRGVTVQFTEVNVNVTTGTAGRS